MSSTALSHHPSGGVGIVPTQETSSLKSFRDILLITGNQQRAAWLRGTLRMTGSAEHEQDMLLQHAKTGQEALLFLRHILPDCVILEDSMRDMSGEEWLASLSPLGLQSAFPLLYLEGAPPPPNIQSFCYQSLPVSSLSAPTLHRNLDTLLLSWKKRARISSILNQLPQFEAPQMPSPSTLHVLTPKTFEETMLPQAHQMAFFANWQRILHHSRSGLWYWSHQDQDHHQWHQLFPMARPLSELMRHFHPHDAHRLQESLRTYQKQADTQETFSSTVRARLFEREDQGDEIHWHWLLCRGVLQSVPWSLDKELWGFFVDVTSFKEEEARLAYLAFHDPLTGLANRSLFMERLRQSLERMRRHKGHATVVLFMDFDGFKAINDNHGHTVGDTLLQQIARRLSRSLRAVDTIARFGGDEFVLLLDTTQDIHDAELVAERTRQQMQEPFDVEELTLKISVSIGALWCAQGDISAEQLISQADDAMYQAKRAGGDRFLLKRAEDPSTDPSHTKG